MKHLLLFTVITQLYCHGFSQSYANTWIFGDSAGLEFKDDTVLYYENVIVSRETSASISDSSGNLLFYTNGNTVWDNTNEIAENGDSLLIGYFDPDDGTSGITQGVIILPKPDHNSIFYIFQIQNEGLKYSIVHINLETGEGEVTDKNIDLYSENIREKMNAVKHANGRDWWLYFLKYPDEGEQFTFGRYLITPDGIEGPWFQEYGPVYTWTDYNGWGQMKFSLDGSKLLFTRGKYLDIYDFDRCTGKLSNWIEILDVAPITGIYGCEFSPDVTKAYVTNLGIGSSGKIYQYCLNCELPVQETKKLIYQNEYEGYEFGQMLLGPDDKIYVSLCLAYFDTIITEINNHLSVINNPNAYGFACDFDTLTVSLGEGRVVFGLPNMPNYNLGALAGSPCDTLSVGINNTTVIHDEIKVYPNPASEYIYIKSEREQKYYYTIKNIFSETLISGDLYSEEKINMNQFASGIYFLELSDINNHVIQIEKIIKL